MRIFSISAFVVALCSFVYAHQAGGESPYNLPQQPFLAHKFIDVSTNSEFFGMTTFANLPYVDCLSTDNVEEGRFDIAILGAPFDTVCEHSRT